MQALGGPLEQSGSVGFSGFSSYIPDKINIMLFALFAIILFIAFFAVREFKEIRGAVAHLATENVALKEVLVAVSTDNKTRLSQLESVVIPKPVATREVKKPAAAASDSDSDSELD